MENSAIYSALNSVVCETFEDDSIMLTPDSKPGDIPGWDSAHFITFIVATESRFGIRFQPAELESLRTIADFVGRIQTKLQA